MTLASYKTIADQIANTLAAVPNVGRVHKYIRLIMDREKLDELALDPSQDRVAVWMMHRESVSEELLSTNQETEIHHPFVLLGYLGFKDEDATELIFQQLIDDIREAFRPVNTLNDVVELRFMVQARSIDYADLQGVLCHRSELTIDVQEFYTP